MSLRVRLLAGMAVVAIMLIGASVLIADNAAFRRSSPASMRSSRRRRCDPATAIFRVNPGDSNTFWIGAVSSTGKVTTILRPNVGASNLPVPKISAKVALAETGSAPRTRSPSAARADPASGA